MPLDCHPPDTDCVEDTHNKLDTCTQWSHLLHFLISKFLTLEDVVATKDKTLFVAVVSAILHLQLSGLINTQQFQPKQLTVQLFG